MGGILYVPALVLFNLFSATFHFLVTVLCFMSFLISTAKVLRR